jgi:hydrogenase maturation protease
MDRTTLVVGCGNLLRGDDAVGPLLVRRLAEEGVPDHVRLVDGGTAGMDIGFAMRGMQRVIIVDAATTGTDAGAIFRVPGEALEELPPPQSMNMHSFRWDNALAFARWLLKGEYPEHIEVWLIEAAQLEPGAPLSEPVEEAMEKLIRRLGTELATEAAVLGSA